MPRHLATKLILALTLIVMVVKGISLWANVRSQQEQALQSMTDAADQLSRSITSATWHAMLADHRDDAYQLMLTIAEKQGIERIRMFNKDGWLTYSTVPTETLQVDERAEVCAPCHVETPPLVTVDIPSRTRLFREPDGRRTMTMITPIYNEPACSNAACHAHPESLSVIGVLDLRLDAGRIDEDVLAMRERTAFMTLLEIGAIGAFLVFFTRRFVEKPIDQLIEHTKAISNMELDEPVRIDGSEELQELAQSFNLMQERLKGAIAENEEFTQQLETKVQERTTELALAHQKLIHADRLASLGQLAASVAHEINNPVSGVLNLSMLMQRILTDEGIPPGRIPDFRRYLGQVSNETARVGRIVSDLLAFSRRSAPHSADVDFNAIIRTTISLVSHKLELSGVSLDLQLDDALPTVRCDSSQIQQVVMNLVLNGGEAIKGEGRVTVKTSFLERDRSVLLEVTDTGSGIPREIASRIFDPFFTTKEEGKGVGLGLAVVYGIVDAHGGDIEVGSRIGEGTKFRITLPLEPPGAAAVT